MKHKSFLEMDSLDKFLTIYLKTLDDSIETTKEPLFKDIYVRERHFINTVVDLVRHIESLSPERLEIQLKRFEQDPELAKFLAVLTSTKEVKKGEIRRISKTLTKALAEYGDVEVQTIGGTKDYTIGSVAVGEAGDEIFLHINPID